MGIRKASAQTSINRSFAAAKAATTNAITIAPSTATTVANGGTLSFGSGSGPTITGITVTDSGYNNLTSTAIREIGGYFKLIGSGFTSGSNIYINNALVTNTFVSSTQINVVAPALSVGTYPLYMFTPTGPGAMLPSGIKYSTAPVWTSSIYAGVPPISIQLLATSDSTITYAVTSGSLPAGISLSSSGLLTGTTATSTYNFTVTATDQEQQSTSQIITLNVINTIPVDYLVVAGGGAGTGGYAGSAVPGGGGGGGGYVEGNVSLTIGTTYSIVVGAGGAYAAAAATNTKGANGADSTFSGSDLSIITAKGGGGGGFYSAGANGGSGGGGGYNGLAGGTKTQVVSQTGGTGYGNAGGVGAALSSGGAGGGGAGGVGGAGGTGPGGNSGAAGGAGKTWLNGTAYAGGAGGSGSYTNGGTGVAGTAGGGTGGSSGVNATSGTANTGGGGGSAPNGSLGGSGGSGVVIIRHLSNATANLATTTGSPSITTSGGYTYYTFTGAGTIKLN